MASSFRISSLVPIGLAVESIIESEDMIKVTARSRAIEARCPSCGLMSRRVRSRYIRQVADLPCAGRRVGLSLIARRFFCCTENCRRRIFAERFDKAVLAGHARRTARLDCIVHHLGLALGGRPAASFAWRLMLPVSNDTLLRVVRRRARPRTEPLTIVGIDDFAFRRNHRYGSIVCDLERRWIVALLPDREVATVEAWLAGHHEIKILSRDRGGGYGEAAAKALPSVTQVADRWHLMENASAAFLNAVCKSMHAIRISLGATTINRNLLTYAEKLQYEGYLRREETNSTIMELVGASVSIKEIARRTGYSRKLVRQVIRGQRTDVFRVRQSSLEGWLAFLDEQWAAGCHNASALWRCLKGKGFRGGLGVCTRRSNSRPRSGGIMRLRGGIKPGHFRGRTFSNRDGRGCLQWRFTRRFDGLFSLKGRAGGKRRGFSD